MNYIMNIFLICRIVYQQKFATDGIYKNKVFIAFCYFMKFAFCVSHRLSFVIYLVYTTVIQRQLTQQRTTNATEINKQSYM